MDHFSKSTFADFGNTGQITNLTDKHTPRGLSPIEMEQLGLNATIATREKKKRNNATRRAKLSMMGQNIMTKARLEPNYLEVEPLNAINHVELNRVRANQERAALIPPMPTFAPPPPPNRSIPPMPKRPLPKMTANQEQKWQNYIREHPLPIEGARRKTRRSLRSLRKRKTHRKRKALRKRKTRNRQ